MNLYLFFGPFSGIFWDEPLMGLDAPTGIGQTKGLSHFGIRPRRQWRHLQKSVIKIYYVLATSFIGIQNSYFRKYLQKIVLCTYSLCDFVQIVKGQVALAKLAPKGDFRQGPVYSK